MLSPILKHAPRTDRQTGVLAAIYCSYLILFIAIMCPMLGNPLSGSVVHGGRSVGSVAMYTCFTGLTLKGNGAGGTRRVCSPDGTWTGSEPTCSKLFFVN